MPVVAARCSHTTALRAGFFSSAVATACCSVSLGSAASAGSASASSTNQRRCTSGRSRRALLVSSIILLRSPEMQAYGKVLQAPSRFLRDSEAARTVELLFGTGVGGPDQFPDLGADLAPGALVAAGAAAAHRFLQGFQIRLAGRATGEVRLQLGTLSRANLL